MKRLGYTRYVAQGGDWGALITEQMALIAPPELIAIHTNMPGTIPPEIVKALAAGSPPPADLGPDEKRAYEQVAFFYGRTPKGCHFAAWEQPKIFTGEVRASFKTLRP